MSQGEYYLSHSVFMVGLSNHPTVGLEVALLTCLNSGYLEFLERLVGPLSFLECLKKLESDLSNFFVENYFQNFSNQLDMKCSLKVQVSNRQCFTLGSAASGMKIFLNIQRWFQCRVFMMYILRTLVLGLRSFTLFFLKHKDRRLRSGGCSAYESLSRIQCDPQSVTSGFEAEFPSANNTVVQESPTLDLTTSPLSCPSMAPPSGLLPCFHGNQSLSRPLNSPLGHLVTTGVPHGTFCGLQVAHGSPARSSRPFLVGLPGCPPAPLGLSPPRLSVQILRCPCPVPGWTPTSVLMTWMSVLSAGLSAAQNVLRSLMSRERDLQPPALCSPPARALAASGMEPSSQETWTRHASLRSPCGLVTAHQLARRLCFHTPGCLPLSPPQAHGPEGPIVP